LARTLVGVHRQDRRVFLDTAVKQKFLETDN